MDRVNILETRIDKICAVIDSLKLHKTNPEAFARIEEAINWTPKSVDNK